MRVYGVIECFNLSEEDMVDVNNMAPPPASAAPFLLPQRATVFVSILPPDECYVVPPHIDEHGSGPLVYGPSITGSCTSFAVCAPDYSQRNVKRSISPELVTIFTSNELAPTTSTTKSPIHVVNLSVCGGALNLPAGCWHVVRSYGSSIRVGYYFQQRT